MPSAVLPSSLVNFAINLRRCALDQECFRTVLPLSLKVWIEQRTKWRSRCFSKMETAAKWITVIFSGMRLN
ncbi:unnamed protein product [Urochloa humidicola]